MTSIAILNLNSTMKFVRYSVLIFVLVSSFADDSPDLLTKCPDFKPMENIDTKSYYKGRWLFVKFYGTVRTGATCSSISFINVHTDKDIEISYSSEYNGIVMNLLKNWTSVVTGEIVLDTNVKIPSLLGEAKLKHVYIKVNYEEFY